MQMATSSKSARLGLNDRISVTLASSRSPRTLRTSIAAAGCAVRVVEESVRSLSYRRSNRILRHGGPSALIWRKPASTRIQVARRALKIIAWDALVLKDKVKIRPSVAGSPFPARSNGATRSPARKTAVRKLSGVIGVTNLITVRPHADARDVKHRIEEALRRNAQLDAREIRVVVEGGKVTLEGHVPAWHERSISETAAWSAAGVSGVEDHIQVR